MHCFAWLEVLLLSIWPPTRPQSSIVWQATLDPFLPFACQPWSLFIIVSFYCSFCCSANRHFIYLFFFAVGTLFAGRKSESPTRMGSWLASVWQLSSLCMLSPFASEVTWLLVRTWHIKTYSGGWVHLSTLGTSHCMVQFLCLVLALQ